MQSRNMKLVAYVGLIVVFIVYSPKVAGVTQCEPGHGYPDFCPQPGDAPNHTRCCKHYLAPTCCEERANSVCLWSGYNSRSGKNLEPGESEYAVFCPQPGQSDDNTVCCSSNNKSYCCRTKLLGAILGGVFGSLALIGIIISIVCCMQVKSGHWVCVQVGPGKWTVVSRARAEKLNHLRQMELNANRTRPPQRCRRTCPYDNRECTVPENTAQRCCGAQCPYVTVTPPEPSPAPPPSYTEVVDKDTTFSNGAYQFQAGPGGLVNCNGDGIVFYNRTA